MRIPVPVTGTSLCRADREVLWDFAQRFTRMSRAQFEFELAECDLVYLLYDEGRALRGMFSFRTQRDDAELPSRTVLQGYWAILDPSVRRHGVPQRCLIDAFLRRKLRAPLRPLWFIFASGTYRSYLMCARTTAFYWPNRLAPTPPKVARLRDRAMQATDSLAYNATRGVLAGLGAVQFLESQPEGDPGLAGDPDIAAWFKWNRGFRQGDQLIVVVPMTVANFLASAWKMWLRRWRRTRGVAHVRRSESTRSL